MGLNATYVYTYDNAGNILTKSVCPLTAEGVTPVPTTTYNYTYGNSAWGDQLTKFGNSSIAYDAIGNPISYNNGKFYSPLMTWKNGRQLTSVMIGANTVSYSLTKQKVGISPDLFCCLIY